MNNLIQSLLPAFITSHFVALPAIALLVVGIFIETQYVGRLTFFLNSVTLISYLGVKDNVNDIIAVIVIAFFLFSTWSFLSYVSKDKIPPPKGWNNLVREYPIILRLGGSAILAIVLLIS